MSGCCSGQCAPPPPARDRRFRRALWIALLANAAMFFVEAAAAWRAESTALLADAVDFLGDAANYGVSLLALAAGAVWRSRVALAKGWTMGLYGVIVLAAALWNVVRAANPEPVTMASIAALALAVNMAVAILLYRFRAGDANMQSVWLCSRNDAIGNLAVMLAAAGVFGTGTLWPDVAVAVVLAVLGLTAARRVIGQARRELSAHAGAVRPSGERRAPLGFLELRVPPLALTAAAAMAMFLLPELPLSTVVPEVLALSVGGGVMAIGTAVAVLGVVEFRRANTTVDPRWPARSARIVQEGVYARTRNPMYLGFVATLSGQAVALQSVPSLALAAVVAIYLHRFQILPEERQLRRRFGHEFVAYCAQVRRWL